MIYVKLCIYVRMIKLIKTYINMTEPETGQEIRSVTNMEQLAAC